MPMEPKTRREVKAKGFLAKIFSENFFKNLCYYPEKRFLLEKR
jgi:hypothetical protein